MPREIAPKRSLDAILEARSDRGRVPAVERTRAPARADEHGVLSAEKRMALAFKVRSQMLGIVDGRIDLS
jgi:hypothetical protein